MKQAAEEKHLLLCSTAIDSHFGHAATKGGGSTASLSQSAPHTRAGRPVVGHGLSKMEVGGVGILWTDGGGGWLLC